MLVEAKSNLARLMATENLIVEERNVSTAYFDPQNRILTVPILNGNLSSELYDLLLGHEVGHALETPAAGWHDSVIEMKVNKDILNVCEDARIEKKIKRKFPGLKPSFSRGYRELLDMDFFGIKDVNVNTLNFIDRVNLYTKGGTFLDIRFNNEETKLLREVENTETFTEVVDVARKIQDFMKAELEKQKQKQEILKTLTINVGEKGDAESEGGEEMQPDMGGTDTTVLEDEKDTKKDFSQKAMDENGKIDEPGENGTEDGTVLDQKAVGQEATGHKNTSNDISSVTDKNFRKKEKTLYEQSKKADIIYSNIPQFNSDLCIVSYKKLIELVHEENTPKSKKENYIADKFKPAEIMKRFVEYKNQSSKVVSYLVKEFELRKNAEKQSRAKVSKTGELNMNRIYEYKLTDDIFKRMTNVPNGKSHGLVMFVDWSGSMQDHLEPTVKQLLNLVMFCKKVNIPYEVYAFTTEGETGVYSVHKNRQRFIIGDIKVNNDLFLLNILSSKMHNQDFVKMASYLLEIGRAHGNYYRGDMYIPEILRLGGTPLNAAIVASFDLVPKFKENNKLQIVNTLFLTDGESALLEGRISTYEKSISKHYVSNETQSTKHRRSFFRDPVTKATVEVQSATFRSGMANCETNALLKLLKQRIDCNLIGFFVAKTREIRNAVNLLVEDVDTVERMMNEFKKTESIVITTTGYDEYYLLRSEQLDTDDDEFVVNSTTTRGLVNAFSKYTGNKVSSRIILNRFIKLIA